jgi:hypothetical protein
MLRHRYEDFPSPLKAHLPRRKAPVASGLRVLPTLPQPLLPGPLALGASGERGRAPGRWSGRRSGGCGGASADRSPLRAARTPTCCAMGPSPPAYTSPPLLAPPRQAPYVLDLGGAAYLETMYPSGPTRYGSQFSIILAVGSSLPRREPARHSLRQLHHPLQRRSLLWRQTVLRPDLHLSHRVCQDGGEGLRAILLRGG